MRRSRSMGALAAAFALALGSGGVAAADPPFVEDEAESLLVLTGDAAGDYFGWIAANIGDITGDGVDELLVPTLLDGTGGAFAGKFTVFSLTDGAELHVDFGSDFELLGYSAAAAGDVNADGIGDYIVGAPGFSSAEPPGGRVVVYSGADHSVLLEFTPETAGFFGSSVAGMGDVDGDGYDDLVVGAARADDPGEDAGQVFAYSGADGSPLWTFDGRHAGDWLGSAVGALGDVNGDGVPDIVVGAQGNGGEAFVLNGDDGSVIHRLRPRPGSGSAYGQFFASGPGDVDADGVPDVLVTDYNAGEGDLIGTGAAYVYSGATGAVIHAWRGVDFEGLGPGRGVGDVNGDGHADLIIAGYTSSEGASAAGRAYVLSGADGSTIRTITSTIENDNFGVDALGVGDVDGDGQTDFAVTAVGQAFLGTGPGVTYIIAGTE